MLKKEHKVFVPRFTDCRLNLAGHVVFYGKAFRPFHTAARGGNRGGSSVRGRTTYLPCGQTQTGKAISSPAQTSTAGYLSLFALSLSKWR